MKLVPTLIEMYLNDLFSLNFRSISLSICTLLCTYTTYRCVKPPNPNPTIPNSKDRVRASANPTWIGFRTKLVILIGIYHAMLCLAGPNPPRAICPQYSNISSSLFHWNPHAAFCISLILLAGRIRLLAYKQLGLDFIFTVHKPKELITTGLYHYVQHPSYAGLIALMIANRMLFERLDGVAACFLPKWIVNLRWIWMTLMIAKTLGWAALRIRDEETMMKATFGKEWEDYNTRTKRMIPRLL